MARPLRIEVSGGWYHVTARGNERRAIYRDDQDRRHFLELAGEAAERFNLAVQVVRQKSVGAPRALRRSVEVARLDRGFLGGSRSVSAGMGGGGGDYAAWRW
jgi:hypothetical protein